MVRWVVFAVHDLRSSVMDGWPTEYHLLKWVRIPGAGWIAQWIVFAVLSYAPQSLCKKKKNRHNNTHLQPWKESRWSRSRGSLVNQSNMNGKWEILPQMIVYSTPLPDSSPWNEGNCFKLVVLRNRWLPLFEKLLSSSCLGDSQIEMPSQLLDVWVWSSDGRLLLEI